MKLIEWNINRSSVNRFRHQLRAISAQQPDVVVLVEVSKKVRADLTDLLNELEFEEFVFSQDRLSSNVRSASGVLIASKWPVYEVQGYPDLPFPDHALTVFVDSPLGYIEVTGLYAAPGAATDSTKIEMLDGIYEYLGKPYEGHRLLTGDFSCPKAEEADGSVIPYGLTNDDEGKWAASELQILKGLEEFGMVDVYRSLHGYEADGWSHQIAGTGELKDLRKRYDHLLASESLKAVTAEYLHDYDNYSDHTPLEVELG